MIEQVGRREVPMAGAAVAGLALAAGEGRAQGVARSGSGEALSR